MASLNNGMTSTEVQEVFTNVYINSVWGPHETKSGRGSNKEQTQYIEKELPILFDKLDIKSILDLPCGEFYWMSRILPKHIKYHGADIVDQIIKNNNEFANDNISFSKLDIIYDKIPQADLVIVRDCFVHLTNDMILKSLNNIKSSGSKYLLTTNFNWKHKPNEDLELPLEGKWRRINLTISPFNLPDPSYVILEGCPEPWGMDKTLSLWRIEDL